MPTLPQTRALRTLALTLILVSVLAPLTPAQALEFPRLADLARPYSKLGVGSTLDEAVGVMGHPTQRSQWQTLGITHETLSWLDISGQRYTARFMAGRLYLKQIGD